MQSTVKNIVKYFEKVAPKYLAEDWDNVGLQIGSMQSKLKGILTTLDVTEEVIDYAIENDYNLIFSHHPMIFKGIKSVDLDSYQGRIIEKLIKNDINVYSAHTNYDIAKGGLNDLAAKRLGLENIKGLQKTMEHSYVKIVVFVPKSHEDIVRKVMGEYGAGYIGNYSNCSFSQDGIGRFKAESNTNPFIGKIGEITEVNEVRIETIISESKANQLISVIKNVHPYEEVAYDIYPLNSPKEQEFLGRIGDLPCEVTVEEFAKIVRKAFPNGKVRFAGANVAKIKRVGLCTGSGASFMKAAKSKGADAYVTGDLKYHEAQAAKEMGLLIADAGHFGTEEIAGEGLATLLKEICPDEILKGIKIDVYALQKDFFLDL